MPWSSLEVQHRHAHDAPEVLPCQEQDPAPWFAERPKDIEFAKTLCRSCPVRSECLAGALDRHEPWGVWGGELLIAGVVVAHKRGRGRPPKALPAA